jgi:manganese/zinc/iron transport system ATP- binding protein
MNSMNVPYCRHCRHTHELPDPKAPALELRDVIAGYPKDEQPTLKGITLTVPVGSSIALVGDNGAGKSTLFKVLSGLLPLKSGHVRVLGHRLGECHDHVVYLPQRSDIDWQFPISVRDLVLTGRYVHLGWFARPSAKDIARVMQALEELGVAQLAGRQIAKLSGGQQQRVLIARALAQDADLLLLDEPLNAVDAETRHVIATVLDDIKSKGRTVIMATHYFDPQDKRYDGAIYLKDGEQVTDVTSRKGHEGCNHP